MENMIGLLAILLILYLIGVFLLNLFVLKLSAGWAYKAYQPGTWIGAFWQAIFIIILDIILFIAGFTLILFLSAVI